MPLDRTATIAALNTLSAPIGDGTSISLIANCRGWVEMVATKLVALAAETTLDRDAIVKAVTSIKTNAPDANVPVPLVGRTLTWSDMIADVVLPLVVPVPTATSARDFAVEVYCVAHQCAPADVDRDSLDGHTLDQITKMIAGRDAALLGQVS